MDWVSPYKFNYNFSVYDIECYLESINGKNKFIPYQFEFYGEKCIDNAINFILNFSYKSKTVNFYAHNAEKFNTIILLNRSSAFADLKGVKQLENKNHSI